MALGTDAALPEDLTQLGLYLSYGALFEYFDGTVRATDPTNERVDATIATLALRHFFGDGWSADAELPAGMVRYRSNNLPSERVTGFGDLRLSGRYDFAALLGPGGYTPSITVRLGVGLPTGTAATLGATGVSPSQLAVGSGSFSVEGSIEVTQFVHRMVALRANVTTRIPLTVSTRRFLFGPQFVYGVGGLLLVGDTVFSAGVSGQSRGRAEELEKGTILRSGGHQLTADLAASYRVNKRVTLALNGRVPFWRKTNGPQVAETFSVGAALVMRFGGAEDEHDHGDKHDHGDEHNHGDEHDHGAASQPHHDHHDVTDTATTAGRVESYRTGGATFDEHDVAVPGHVTVVDFWAEWCAPCKDLDRRLHKLAAADPTLVVRRVEVPTFDTPVATEHLDGAEGLPVIWIYDQHGERIGTFEKIAPDDAMKAVRAALATGT